MTTSDRGAVVWDAPDLDHPARRASRRSYDAVVRKAKDEWLALFAEDAELQDPVGPSFFDPEGHGHRGRAAISAFWDLAIAPVVEFRFHIRDSFANGDACANVGTFTTLLEDGSLADTELVAVYRLDAAGLIASMHAHWEVDRTLASLRKA
ncbi:nuclear transport factor 2 family protein [Nocardioides sp. HDW12B]|uniref:nuclear transport factor 2 family protein n=1 Tax=Nocardioides sp. HDW12B TaxID=2714939 RepID=UPI0014084076|nr:nuclear transport factor 2 family protein [Nocardioides sp. HDW12B]QIK68144.1 nuclear transport factor 2 family protein [Nocardioides sp. HDW12B]